jgi:hypothetical protein
MRIVRTLGTQVRLRRLLRLEGELAQRLVSEAADSRLRRLAARRLLEAIGDVRSAWTADLRAAGEGAGQEAGQHAGREAGQDAGMGELRRHVSRALAALELLAASLERPAPNLVAADSEFRQVAVPLLFFLRGVEDAGDQALRAWLAPEPLRRTA